MSEKFENKPGDTSATSSSGPGLGSYKDEDYEDDEALTGDEVGYLDDDDDEDEIEDLDEDEDDEDLDEDEVEDLDDDDDDDYDDDDDDDDEEYDDEDLDEDEGEDQGGYITRADQASALYEQLMSSPLLAQVSQMLGGSLSGPEKTLSQARLMKATGDLEGAAQLYLNVIEEAGDNYQAYEELAQILLAMDKPQEAEVFLQKAIDLQPQTSSAYLYMGYAHYARQQFDRCVEDFQKAAELNPDSHIALNNLGYAQYLLEHLEDAAQSFIRAGDVGSDRAYYNLGMVRLLQGQEKEAATAYRDAADMDPRGQQIEDHLEDLEKAKTAFPARTSLLEQAATRLRERLSH